MIKSCGMDYTKEQLDEQLIPVKSCKLIKRQSGNHIGFFRTAESAKAEIKRVSSEYKNGLLVKIDNIVDGNMPENAT